MILNVRGPSGAGKSWIARRLLEAYPSTKRELVGVFTKKKPRVVGYELPGGLFVMGNYEFPTSGGMDGFRPMDNIKWFTRQCASRYLYVFYESLLLAQQKGFVQELNQEYPGRMTLGILDTTAEGCVAAVYQRNGGKPIKEKVITVTHHRINRVANDLKADGLRVVSIPRNESFSSVVELFKGAGWNPNVV